MDARDSPGEPVQQEVCFQFDRFRACAYTRKLLEGDHPVSIENRPFEVLLYLIRNRHRAVPKAELEAVVWGGRPVSDTVVSRCIMKVRQALRDDSNDKYYIRTVRGFGYQFFGEVTEESLDLGDGRLEEPVASEGDRNARGRIAARVARNLGLSIPVLAVIAGLTLVLFEPSRMDIPRDAMRRFMVAVQPVQSAETDRLLAERLTMALDRMLAGSVRFESMPTTNAFSDSESGFLPEDCLILETRLTRQDKAYRLHYHLTVPRQSDLVGEFDGRNPRNLARRVVSEVNNWAAARQDERVPR